MKLAKLKKYLKLKKILAVVARTALLAAIIVASDYISTTRPSNSVFINKYASSDVVYADGTAKHVNSKNFGTVSAGDTVTVHVRLPETPICENPVMAFYIYHSVTEIWLGDRLLDSYGADIAARGDMVCNHRFLTPLPDEAWGNEVTIILRVTENKAFSRIRNLRLYDAENAYEYYIDSNPIGFYTAFPMLFLGLCVLLVLLLNGKADIAARKAMYLAAFAVLAATWIIGSHGMQHLFGFDAYILTVAEFAAVFLMALPVLAYALETEPPGKFRQVLKFSVIAYAAFFIVCTALNFTNILHYCATLALSNVLTFLSGLLLLVFAVRRLRRGGESGGIFFNGMIILFCCGLLEIMRFNGYKYVPFLSNIGLPSFLPLGVLFFLIYIIRSFIAESRERNVQTTRAELKAGELKRMVEDLRISEERYKLALEQSGKVFFVFDIPNRTLHLPQSLADAFGLPLAIDNMPENFISRGLLDGDGAQSYRDFYGRILAGEKSGEAVVACHKPREPGVQLWHRVSFSSTFDGDGVPVTAVITYEDLSEQHRLEIDASWKQLGIASLRENSYAVGEYDLTANSIIKQTGEMFETVPEHIASYEQLAAYVLEHFIYAEDVPACGEFWNRQRLLRAFEEGTAEDSIEYRSARNGRGYRWTNTSAQLIADPYSKHTLVRLCIVDIHESKSGELQARRDMEQLRRELDNSRIKVMINQMQPHFLYNALSAIKLITKRDPDRAYNLIQDFTVHLRSGIKALSSDEPIFFTEELGNIRAYMNIELTRFGDRLHVEYDIRCEDFEVVPLSIQPLVENAVKHGVFPKGAEGGTVTVRSYETESAYVVEVRDDGAGFDVEAAMAENNNSYGLKNLVFRLKTLMHAEVLFKSGEGEGTLVTVTLPKNMQKGRENA